MTNEIDILIRNARLRDSQGALLDIAIADGRFTEIGKLPDYKGRIEINAEGNLVTASYVNPHLHLCKVWTLPGEKPRLIAVFGFRGERFVKRACDDVLERRRLHRQGAIIFLRRLSFDTTPIMKMSARACQSLLHARCIAGLPK
jgi:hypothetical protein